MGEKEGGGMKDEGKGQHEAQPLKIVSQLLDIHWRCIYLKNSALTFPLGIA